MKKILSFLFYLTLFSFPIFLNGQDTISLDVNVRDTIFLRNPSFEDVPRRGDGYSPQIFGWFDCGLMRFRTESPPDIHPVPGGTAWGVDHKAMDGNTYLGLVTRYSGSYESVSQDLSKEMVAGKCYMISASLMLSPKYESMTKRSGQIPENFSNAVILRIWGGRYPCDKYDLLAQSKPVENNEWQNYILSFRPKSNISSLIIEAFFITNTEFYNGHLLLDNLSPIIEISCD